MTQQKKQVVSYEEQKTMGLLRPARNYVQAEIVPQARQIPAALSAINHTISVPATSTQHIEVKTNSVDRAKGFLIAGVPLYAAYGVGMLIVSVALFDTPVLSFTGFIVFWLSFIGAWGWGYFQTLRTSAEGVAYYEAKRKWDVIEREQSERWNYYKQSAGDK
jgi:hypothetical protein